MRSKAFHDYIVHDVFGNYSGITSRAMFGGWGIYKQGKIFSIIVGDQLYIKHTDQNASIFEEFESGPFTYKRKDGKEISMSYWLIPEEIMNDRDLISRLIVI